jgi:glycosyltransferase involved in cell wall biosynthesis
MKIKWQGFLGKNHSWSIVGQNFCRQFAKLGHTVHMNSTNGLEHFPEDLSQFLVEKLDNDYDLEMSYTRMSNFPNLLQSSKNSIKFGIYCFEFAGKNALPTGFAKNVKYCTKLLPPSNFAKQVMLDSGVQESSMTVVPHGVDFDLLQSAPKYNLKTKKKHKIILVAGQPHLRKGLDLSLDVFGKAFTSKDDVCLVLKIVDKEPESNFEVSFKEIYKKFNNKYPKHAEIEIIREFIPNMGSLYRECDIHFNLTLAEGFGIPFLEATAFNLINIAPRYGGQLDFLNDNNSILVSGKIVPAPPQALYYEQKLKTNWFKSDIEAGVEALRAAITNLDKLKTQFNAYNLDNKYKEKYSWETISKQVLSMCNK